MAVLSALCAALVVAAYFVFRASGWDGWVVVMAVAVLAGIVSAAIAIARGNVPAGAAVLLVHLGLVVGFGVWVLRLIGSAE